jgi:hypothetical protein
LCLIIPLSVALIKGDLKAMFDYRDHDDENDNENENDNEKKKNKKSN